MSAALGSDTERSLQSSQLSLANLPLGILSFLCPENWPVWGQFTICLLRGHSDGGKPGAKCKGEPQATCTSEKKYRKEWLGTSEQLARG